MRIFLFAMLLSGCEDQDELGSLVDVRMESKVGVLLDELPQSMRDRVATSLIAKPAQFWTDRAKAQIRLAVYRLIFRANFYDEADAKAQLPLPPESVWTITLDGAPKRVTGAHDTVEVGYTLTTTILSDADSPAISEPALAKTDGKWFEPYVFPVDPELLLQRTGYACMDEADFPRGSVDAEEVDTFYDDTCEVEDTPSGTGCHNTVLPDKSCVQALEDRVGKVETYLTFTRAKWEGKRADKVRVGAAKTNGSDLEIYLPDFEKNRVIYRWFAPDSCELVEKCVGAAGWRRLLQVHTSDENTGADAVDVGDVDYYVAGTMTLNDQYHIFEYSACHNHFHFTHYGTLSFGAAGALSNKQGFCLQSTNRTANAETSPLHNPYGTCEVQGIAAGWVDQYKIGLPCQWVDVTNVNAPASAPLKFASNPDGFVCEGTPIVDVDGKPRFETTTFKTERGETVSRPMCERTPGAAANNDHEYDATVPAAGEGYLTQPCTRGQLGPLRNCGLTQIKERVTCTAGAVTRARCTIPAGSAPQVVRFCEYSALLQTGTACMHGDGLASALVTESGVDVEFTCPAARAAAEPGGAFARYTGPAVSDDASAAVTCTLQ